MEVEQLEVCSDSQLVVRHIEDSYEGKGKKMILYLKKGTRVAQKVRMGSGQTCTKNGEFKGRRPG